MRRLQEAGWQVMNTLELLQSYATRPALVWGQCFECGRDTTKADRLLVTVSDHTACSCIDGLHDHADLSCACGHRGYRAFSLYACGRSECACGIVIRAIKAHMSVSIQESSIS